MWNGASHRSSQLAGGVFSQRGWDEQRLLRRPPSILIGECIQSRVYIRPDLSERDLAMRLAAYNMVSVAVCDEGGRLLGAATVDDVLDKVLPPDWRRKERR